MQRRDMIGCESKAELNGVTGGTKVHTTYGVRNEFFGDGTLAGV